MTATFCKPNTNGWVSSKALVLSTIAVSFGLAVPSYGQRAGNQFDPNFQKRILREYAGPTALCQEVRLGLECSEKFATYAVSAQGGATTTAVSLFISQRGDGPDAAMSRMFKFAEHFGFGREETFACITKAADRAQEAIGHADELLANANYKMHCRAWKTQVDLIMTLIPKSSF